MSNSENQNRDRIIGVPVSSISETVAVGTGTTVLFTITTPGIYRIHVKNNGGTALNTFAIQGRNSVNGAWITVANTTTQFTTIPDSIKGFLLRSDDTINPTLLASTQEWEGAINSKTFRYLRATATVGAGSTSLYVEVN